MQGGDPDLGCSVEGEHQSLWEAPGAGGKDPAEAAKRGPWVPPQRLTTPGGTVRRLSCLLGVRLPHSSEQSSRRAQTLGHRPLGISGRCPAIDPGMDSLIHLSLHHPPTYPQNRDPHRVRPSRGSQRGAPRGGALWGVAPWQSGRGRCSVGPGLWGAGIARPLERASQSHRPEPQQQPPSLSRSACMSATGIDGLLGASFVPEQQAALQQVASPSVPTLGVLFPL